MGRPESRLERLHMMWRTLPTSSGESWRIRREWSQSNNLAHFPFPILVFPSLFSSRCLYCLFHLFAAKATIVEEVQTCNSLFSRKLTGVLKALHLSGKLNSLLPQLRFSWNSKIGKLDWIWEFPISSVGCIVIAWFESHSHRLCKLSSFRFRYGYLFRNVERIYLSNLCSCN